MKRIFTLLAIVGLTITSCEKDETIDAKDYENHVETANVNSTEGEVAVNPHTGVEEAQYYYSVQYGFEFASNELYEGVVNSSADYDNVVLPKDPANGNDLTEKLPMSGDWDILISQYLTEDSYEDEGVTKYQAYDVVGVLINTGKGIKVANVKDSMFDTITLDEAEAKMYEDDVDFIGFNWKELNFATFTYDIVQENYYLVKLSNGDIYKLKFEDFYGTNPGDNPNETNDLLKGHIKYQYQLLQ